jgi:ubiquinone/menaquinone biosynthesis C-methylase UbiE
LVCHGGFSLDESVRRSWYNPEAILNEIGLKSGMVFMDIGCGEGFFTQLAAKAVGEKGIVYAVDSDPNAIQRLREKAEKNYQNNIIAKVEAAEKTIFCTDCADIVFYSMVLHDFNDPVQVLNNAKEMLKPLGKLVDLDWKKIQMAFGPPFNIRFSEEDASKLMNTAGFSVQNTREVGRYHYIITAKTVS